MFNTIYGDVIDRQRYAVSYAVKSKGMTELQFFEKEIARFKKSQTRKDMITGELYYSGEQDILKRKIMSIGPTGVMQEVSNVINNKLIDNQYASAVDKKVNYLVARPITINTDDDVYQDALAEILNDNFHLTLKNLTTDCLNHGISYIHVYYDTEGRLGFKRIPAYEIIPFWVDSEHTVLDKAVRVYRISGYEGTNPVVYEKVEIYSDKGVEFYELNNGNLVPDVSKDKASYIIMENEHGDHEEYNWGKIPLIAFKYNNIEQPLISKVKTLQDALNKVISDFQNNMEESPRNTILILKNYGGTNLAEFRQNLNSYGAVKITTVDGVVGGVDTLRIEVNSENYKVIINELKKAVIENARSYDSKDDKLSSNPNQLNILSMYSDMDLDASGMESEFQAGLKHLLYFINIHLLESGTGDFKDTKVTFVFNKNTMVNNSEIIENCVKSSGMISHETILSHHPWVKDVLKEMAQLKKEEDTYSGVFENDLLAKKSEGSRRNSEQESDKSSL